MGRSCGDRRRARRDRRDEAQMLFFTLVAALFVGMKVLTSYVIPEIPQGILLLMGISNGVYMTAKFIPD
jgi:hypothetical protein